VEHKQVVFEIKQERRKVTKKFFCMWEVLMIRFPKIHQFRQCIREVALRSRFGEVANGKSPEKLPTLTFTGTVKLHGTNAAIVRKPDGSITYQSRLREITLLNDNAGFAWAMTAIGEDFLNQFLKANLSPGDDETCIIFGEWCGKGIQKGCAVHQLDKMFVIFAAMLSREDKSRWVDLTPFSAPEHRIFNILDFPTYQLEIDFENPAHAQERLQALVREIEACCPVAKVFGVDGIGEGLVWKCSEEGYRSSKLWFKTKGEKHLVSKVKTVAAVDVEKVESIQKFIDMVLTSARLSQGISALIEEGLPVDRRSTGRFLSWIAQDVVSEEKDVIIANGLQMNEVSRQLKNKARDWFFEKIDDPDDKIIFGR